MAKEYKEEGAPKEKTFYTRVEIFPGVLHNGSKTESVSFPHRWGFTVSSTTSTVTYTSLLLSISISMESRYIQRHSLIRVCSSLHNPVQRAQAPTHHRKEPPYSGE